MKDTRSVCGRHCVCDLLSDIESLFNGECPRDPKSVSDRTLFEEFHDDIWGTRCSESGAQYLDDVGMLP
jgi:hypothetical protein